MTDDRGVRTERDGSTLEVVLARPEVRNAQTPATWQRLTEIGEQVAADGTVATVILRAEGPSFSAGLDRRMFTPEGVPGEPSLFGIAQSGDPEPFIAQAQRAFTWWREVPAVTIAAVRGHAVGAGFQLALGCDLIVAAPDASFAMRETSWGLVPDLGGTSILAGAAGYGRALEACATGRWVSVDEMTAWGLVQRVSDDPDVAARDLAGALQATPPGAVAALKPLLRDAGDRSRGEQLAAERSQQVGRLHALAAVLRG